MIFSNGLPSESFFPGPQAMAALAPAEWRELHALFPELAFGLPRQVYGAPARAYSRRHMLPEAGAALALAV